MVTVRTTTLTLSPLMLLLLSVCCCLPSVWLLLTRARSQAFALGIDTAHYLLTVGPLDLTHRQPSCGLPLSGAALLSRHQALSSVWTASEKLLWFCGKF